MKRSEIFDSFVKIAQEKGMISNDSNDSKKKLEQTGRADSLDADAIAALYGVRPDASKAMDYKQNIMEVAHPNSIVVSPSYDKLNGLVESEQERQNILLRIVNKTPDGLSTQRKYAEKELTLALVRLANNFDNINQDKLRKLADSCLMQLAGPGARAALKKEALGPVAIAAIAAAALGAIYAHQHLPDANKGIEENYKRLVDELDDFLEDNNVGLGIKGHEYSAELLSDVREFKNRLSEFMTTYRALNDIIRELERPKDAKELIEISQKPKTHTVINAVAKLRTLITNMSSFIEAIYKNFSSDFYKTRHTKSKGIVDELLETEIFGVSLKGGTTGFVADDFQDVVNAITPFKKSVSELLKIMENAQSVEQKSATDLSEAQAKAKEDFGSGVGDLSGPPQVLSLNPKDTKSVKPLGKSIEDVEKEADELSKLLSST